MAGPCRFRPLVDHLPTLPKRRGSLQHRNAMRRGPAACSWAGLAAALPPSSAHRLIQRHLAPQQILLRQPQSHPIAQRGEARRATP